MQRRAISVFLIVIAIAFLAPVTSSQDGRAAERVTTYDTFATDQPVIALTFDVTFDRGDGQEVLDILAQHGVRATFAVTGVWAQGNPDLMQRIVLEGHQIINHTWSHPSLTGEFTGSMVHDPRPPLSRDEVIEQIQRVDLLVRDQVGIEMRPYFRPPYGDYNDEVLAAMADAGYTLNIMWTVDTFGWHGDPVEDVIQRALDAAQPGANILMHVGHGSTDGEALPEVIRGLRELGYSFATVREFVEGDLAPPEPPPVDKLEISDEITSQWWRFGGVFGPSLPLKSR